jgi:hypothetical protein
MPARHFPAPLFVLLAFVVALFSGCATTPVTYKVHDSAATRAPALRQVVIAPIDAELAELTAGGVLEPRAEWTETAAKNLSAAFSTETGFNAVAPTEPATRAELEEVQSLLRAITINRFSAVVPGGAPPFPAAAGPLNYNTGSLAQQARDHNADAILYLFIRDSYATAGRKSLIALSVLGAALTGVAIVPAMGSTAMSAALVDRDGTVLWFNHSLGGHDPRQPEGARALARQLLAGMPLAKR